MYSALYVGHVRHRRFQPHAHEFRHGLYMVYLDLAELDRAFAGRWFWSTRRLALARFKRADYLGDPAQPLDEAVRQRVAQVTGQRPNGPIRMLTHLRYFGYVFNPVTFYYVHDAADTRVETIVAEITNTPWKERHSYVLPQDGQAARVDVHRHRFAKDFHVSPFMPMAQDYDWRFSTPSQTLSVHMENLQAGEKVFDATLALERQAITSASLARVLLFFPLMTAQVIVGIHWQALRLWLKRTPFHTHPSKRAPEPTPASATSPQEPKP
ncbi:DUF1365 domain-containing protein [Hylemonella gracilis]|uniref:DUF1365 domain-containing protein n=1 Tax=Hylemonella gracilis TaxID=80880 RepID=A0A4P6ULL5_9BURK|nr:DUF1365 domain-containing protein [Hylemonella gracilis]QBK05070.1 DUF1365 domain-containing protein [Hylemonella gracilis]